MDIAGRLKEIQTTATQANFSDSDFEGLRERARQRTLDALREAEQKERESKVEAKITQTLPRRYQTKTLDNYDFKDYKKSEKVIREYVEELTEAIESGDDYDGGLILLGSVGTGKTHIAAAIARATIEAGGTASFGTYKSHLEALQAEISAGSEQRHLKDMKTADLLVLDDIGREKLSDYTYNTLYSVINSRYEECKATIITTNLSPAELVRYLGDAVYSRLYETCRTAVFAGDDYRRR